jgi:threonylcarbamoyladenosine tRNA methylthiotransferase MtaB
MLELAETGRMRFITFGCKANQYDAEVLREALRSCGWCEAPHDQELVVIQTCTVTAEAGRRARQVARRVARENPAARIAMCGCLAESEPESLRELPGVEWVLGNEAARRPADFLAELGCASAGEAPQVPGIRSFTGHTRAFLKIQDGCDMACSFCIVPSVRGPARSRPIAELVAELRRLLASGHREIVLCGIHIGHWGRDLQSELAALVEELARVSIDEPSPGEGPGDWRLRLSSIEATEVSDRLLELMASHPRLIAPHLHMPLQSGDDGVLRAMNRWYGVERYLEACARIRERLERPAFTTDVIVGFPGEGPRAFENTLETARRAGFARIHAFPFSPRPGTAAARPEALAGAVAAEQLSERRARLGELAREMARDYRLSLDGRRETLVLEQDELGLSGRYQRVRVPGAARGPGLLDVRLRCAGDEAQLVGEPVEPAERGGRA